MEANESAVDRLNEIHQIIVGPAISELRKEITELKEMLERQKSYYDNEIAKLQIELTAQQKYINQTLTWDDLEEWQDNP